MQLQNKVFVVTGGGNGLGRELVLNLLYKGAKVAAVDINAKGLEETSYIADKFASGLSTHIVDITNKDKVFQLPEQVVARHGQIDGLINNAGIIQPFVKVSELELSKIEQVMQVNFFGATYMTKAFLPHLQSRNESSLVNVSSMGGFFPVPGQTIYGASKAALKLFTEGLQSELLNTGVKVTLVLPGGMGTDITKNSGVKMNAEMEKMQGETKILSPQKAAEIIVSGVQKNKSRILVGTDAKLMDMLYRLMPSFAARMFAKFMGDKLVAE